MTRLLIRAAGWLLPAERRSEWRREWEAEIWYARRDGVPSNQLRRWCWGAVSDAASIGLEREIFRRRWNRAARTPAFCLTFLAGLILLIAAASGGLPATRAVFFPLPYSNPDRIATIAQGGGTLSMRGGIPTEWVRIWAARSTTLKALATYGWSYAISGRQHILTAEVSPGFFPLLGRTVPGSCANCILLSESFRRQRFPNDRDAAGRQIVLDGRPYRISGVLPSDFWFLSRDIAVWKIGSPRHDGRTGVVIRLRPGVTRREAEQELHSLLERDGYFSWDSLAEVSILQERVRSPLGSFLLALSLALFAAISGSRPRLQHLDVTSRAAWLRGAFFLAKSGLLLVAVLLAGLEFTSACSITMIGGTDLLAEPLSTWLFLIGCMTALTWSIHDHRVRCRVCLHRLGLAAHVGCPGSLLLGWAGTEMVCISGHGMLHVPEMPSCWLEPEHWTALDSSWRELFAHHG